MWLKLLIVLLAVGVNNSQTENAVINDNFGQQPLALLAQTTVQLLEYPAFRTPFLRYLYNLANLPKYRPKIIQLFNYLRNPRKPSYEITITLPLLQEVILNLRHPVRRDFLIDAVLKKLAGLDDNVPENEPNWSDVPETRHQIGHLISPLLKDPHLFQTIAHQITRLLQEPSLKSSWVQFFLKLEKPIPNRKALIKALYTIFDIPDAKQFAIHAIILTLQHQGLRQIFMKNFFEMLLSRTFPTPIAMQIIKILYTQMTDQVLVETLIHVLQNPRIRYRLTAMILNILFEPGLRPLVISTVLDVIRHPMFYPIILYHTQQMMIHLMNDLSAMDYTLAILQIPQARKLVNNFALLILEQPVQVSIIFGLMEQDESINYFVRQIIEEYDVRPAANAIFGIRYFMSSPQMYDRLGPFVANMLNYPKVNEVMSHYLLNLMYQPSLMQFMQTILSEEMVQQMQNIVQEEIEQRQVFVEKIRYICEKEIQIFNPQGKIPVIPIPKAKPQPLPDVVPLDLKPIPIPGWEIPRPPLTQVPGPYCPPPIIIQEQVYVPIVPSNGAVSLVVNNILQQVQARNYPRVYQIIGKLLMNPLTEHQAVLQVLQQPLLRPYLFAVLGVFAQRPNIMSRMSPMLLSAFRKTAQDTVVFRDIMEDEEMFGQFQEILSKISQPELRSELHRFWLDFIRNSGVDLNLQERAVSQLDQGLEPDNLRMIGKSLRMNSL